MLYAVQLEDTILKDLFRICTINKRVIRERGGKKEARGQQQPEALKFRKYFT